MDTSPWIVLKDGSDYSLTPPFGSPPTVECIAHSLAAINRFSGHTLRPYSVAEHSCLCLEIARRAYPEADNRFLLTVLCHDAAESITGDMATPFKCLLGDAWTRIERDLEEHVLNGLYPGLFTETVMNAVEIKQIDLTALWIERRDLLAAHTRKWEVLDSPSFEPLRTKIKIYRRESHWTFWQGQFLYHFHTLAG